MSNYIRRGVGTKKFKKFRQQLQGIKLTQPLWRTHFTDVISARLVNILQLCIFLPFHNICWDYVNVFTCIRIENTS